MRRRGIEPRLNLGGNKREMEESHVHSLPRKEEKRLRAATTPTALRCTAMGWPQSALHPRRYARTSPTCTQHDPSPPHPRCTRHGAALCFNAAQAALKPLHPSPRMASLTSYGSGGAAAGQCAPRRSPRPHAARAARFHAPPAPSAGCVTTQVPAAGRAAAAQPRPEGIRPWPRATGTRAREYDCRPPALDWSVIWGHRWAHCVTRLSLYAPVLLDRPPRLPVARYSPRKRRAVYREGGAV
jgi:hypothetical protein